MMIWIMGALFTSIIVTLIYLYFEVFEKYVRVNLTIGEMIARCFLSLIIFFSVLIFGLLLLWPIFLFVAVFVALVTFAGYLD